jgi:hypothetical protein
LECHKKAETPPIDVQNRGKGLGLGLASALFWLLLLLLLLLVILLLQLLSAFRAPIRSDGASGKNPKGDAHGCASFSAAAWMPRQKIPLAQ